MELEKHALKKASSWKWSDNLNLESKVSISLTSSEEELLKLLTEHHQLSAPKNLIPSDIDPNDFQHIFRYAILTLPREYKVFLSKHLVKIFLVRGIGVSSLTVELSEDGKSNTGKFISYLDIDVLNQKINDWYKWREFTAFKPHKKYTFKPYLSHNSSVLDTSQMALSYLVAIILNWNPKYFPASREEYFLSPTKFKFLNQSWKMVDNIITPKREDLTEDLHHLRYYSKGEPLFSTLDQPNFYLEVEKTNFFNLFSLTGSSKDFIESIANYLYIEKFKHPFSIDFYHEEKLSSTFESCWQLTRCQQKKEVIESIIKEEIQSIE